MTSDPFDISNSVVDGKFNPNHPNISKIYTNVNLMAGPQHWKFRSWNPTFGDINRYSLVEWVGDGRYSDVFIALQDRTTKCAIKLLKPVNADRVRRELKILTEVQGHRSILKLMDIVIDGYEGIPSMVTQYVPNKDWRELFTSFNMRKIKFYTYRLLQALQYTHERGIMHRDVKPLNILCINPEQELVLADWGLAEFYHPMRKYSTHVATRYYKSPEILLGYEYYDYSLDIWSVGVILLEMLSLRMHVFDGDEANHQIDTIADALGGAHIINYAKKYRIHIASDLKSRLERYPGSNLITLIPYSRSSYRDPEALDLVKKMLTIDHKERITAADALKHPFFSSIAPNV